MKKYLTISLWILAFSMAIFSCNNRKSSNQLTEKKDILFYNEQYRPQFHFSPEANWMNDPNGMVYLDGEYHLFYQYYPDSTVWGPMHWGHAVSTDMIHWQHLPIALYPDSLGYIFSGSAVVDVKNTSGLGTAQNPAMIAIFTYHNATLEKSGGKTFQSQGIAYSIDKGRTWTKYSGNPVLKSPGIRDFRDPKVFWHTETNKWIMILAVQDRIHLYSSPNLITWTFESEFGSNLGAHGGVWECPDLFRLEVEGGNAKKWVMFVSINPGGPNGGSATQYFTGEFDGRIFVPDNIKEKWVDYGRDDYAGVTWSNIPKTDGRRLFLGWMSNWDYATVVPTSVWRSAMTIPRELSLVNLNKELLVISRPVSEINILSKNSTEAFTGHQTIDGEKDINNDSIDIMQCELKFDFDLTGSRADSVGIILENDLNEKVVFGYTSRKNRIFVDRKAAGNSSFSEKFAGVATAPYTAGTQLKFHLFIDAASTELFVDDGKLVMTNLVFPTKKYTKIKVFSNGGQCVLDKGELYGLKSIWR
jgi:fructan beta-fructosidase